MRSRETRQSSRVANPDFGAMEDFDDLAEEMHRRDLKLIMNMVLNHASDEHAWFKESRASRTSPKKDWYHRNGSDKNKSRMTACRTFLAQYGSGTSPQAA